MRNAVALLAVLLLAALLRFVGLDWDQGQHLHPDERFLTMLGVDARLPDDLASYLDPARSTLDPYNLGRDFYVYGMLPVTLNELVVTLLHRDTYAQYPLWGRALSAGFDLLTTLLVFLLARALERDGRLDPRLAYVAALAYAASVLPIQQAHFFTVDSFLVFFTTAAILAGTRFFHARSPLALGLSGGALGLAVACKLSALAALPLLLAFVLLEPSSSARAWPDRRAVGRRLGAVAALLAVAYLALRLADPHLFASASLLDPRLDPRFLRNLATLRELSRPGALYPPAVQWIDRTPVLFPLRNLALFGLGLPLFLLSLLGGGLLLRRGGRACRLLVIWALAFLLLQSAQFVATLRYFQPLVPVFAVAAARGALALVARVRLPGWRRALSAAGLVAILAWPLAFTRIYTRPHARVVASRWLLAHVPPGSVIAGEHWDDALPLPIGGSPPRYSFASLPVFLPDTAEKWREMDRILGAADYVVLSSNRGYGSIGRLPERYPRMADFYRDLFAGRRGFRKVAEFTSFPTLLGLAIEDQCAEEAFTVYDHPKVTVFERIRGR